MDRVELIKSMVGRKKAVAVIRPAGAFVAANPGTKAVTRIVKPQPITRGTIRHDAFRPLKVVTVLDYLTRAPEGQAKEWQPSRRHGAHVLTKIAERLRRTH